MRLLSALVLTHCFGCVFPKESDDENEFKKLYPLRSTKNDFKCNSSSTIANAADKCIYENPEEHNYSTHNQINFLRKYYANDRKKIGHHDYDLEQSKSICLHRYFLPIFSNIKGHAHVQVKTSMNCKRKLLSYTEKTNRKDSTNIKQFRETNAQLQKKEHKVSTKDIENADQNHNSQWDEWGNWSACSVTCGSGRQVRWRHCSNDDCMKGLKKAQIKSCRLKDCDKNILHWLGIKS